MKTPVTFRSASSSDVEGLIELMMISSWGGIRLAWERVRSGAESWRDRGRSEIADRDSEIGYSRFVVAEADGKLAAMILLNLISDTSSIDIHRAPEQEVGALRLIRLSSHSLFIREIATAEWARGRGLGSEMLTLAERAARSNAVSRTTLIVNDGNAGAEKLYLRHGYRTIAEEASVGHPRFPDGSRLLLMEKHLVETQKQEVPGSTP